MYLPWHQALPEHDGDPRWTQYGYLLEEYRLAVFAFDEPGGRLEARVAMAGGRAARIEMGGTVRLGEERKIEL